MAGEQGQPPLRIHQRDRIFWVWLRRPRLSPEDRELISLMLRENPLLMASANL
jgi:hypothetical protein